MRQLLTISFLAIALTIAPTDPQAVIGDSTPELSARIIELLETIDSKINNRFAQVDSLRHKLATSTDEKNRIALTREIIAEYETLSFDSLSNFCDKSRDFAMTLPDGEFTQWLNIAQANANAQKGAVAEALNAVMNEIRKGAYPANRISIFRAIVKITLGATDLYDEPIASFYRKTGRQYIDSLRECIYKGSSSDVLLSGISNQIDGKYGLAAADYIEVIRSPRSNATEISRGAYLLSNLYSDYGRKSEAKYYLELSAFYDMTSADLTGSALPRLGFAMIDSGEVDLGRIYLVAAFKNASKNGIAGHARLFTQRIPYVLDGYYSEMGTTEWRNDILIFLLASTSIFFAFRWRYSCRKNTLLRQDARKLNESITAKDKSFSSFIDLSSGIIEKQDEFIKLIRRKITASQIEDVLTLTHSRKPYDSNEDEIMSMFDKAFITAFPQFVKELNNLFEPEKQITAARRDSLTPELRVAAMSRLGIDDAGKVSRFLSLSLNTVYTYRNKLKSRAKSRETFDTDIRNLSC